MKQLAHRKITVTEKVPQFKSANKARVYISLLTYGHCSVTKATEEVNLEPQLPVHLILLTVNLFRTVLTAHNSGLDFWIVSEMNYPLLAPLAQDLLSAAAPKHVERVLGLWRADSW